MRAPYGTRTASRGFRPDWLGRLPAGSCGRDRCLVPGDGCRLERWTTCCAAAPPAASRYSSSRSWWRPPSPSAPAVGGRLCASLYLAARREAWGHGGHFWFPESTPLSAYALVSWRRRRGDEPTPLSAILILFEITRASDHAALMTAACSPPWCEPGRASHYPLGLSDGGWTRGEPRDEPVKVLFVSDVDRAPTCQSQPAARDDRLIVRSDTRSLRGDARGELRAPSTSPSSGACSRARPPERVVVAGDPWARAAHGEARRLPRLRMQCSTARTWTRAPWWTTGAAALRERPQARVIHAEPGSDGRTSRRIASS